MNTFNKLARLTYLADISKSCMTLRKDKKRNKRKREHLTTIPKDIQIIVFFTRPKFFTCRKMKFLFQRFLFN